MNVVSIHTEHELVCLNTILESKLRAFLFSILIEYLLDKQITDVCLE